MWRSGFLVSAVLVPFCSLVGHEVWLLTANLRYRTSRPDAVATMMAVTYSAHGKARAVLQMGSVAQPQQPPAQGMLVIRVVAAALNPVDFKQLRNDQPDALVPKPRTLGFDVSGVVVAAGEGSGFDIGDAVYGMLPLVGSPWGALSEFTVAEAKCFAKAPRTIPLEQAAALPLVSLTVMQVFEQAGLLPGEDRKEKTILIQAAAGGVGSFAVQYARNVLGFGHVLGTCSAPNESLVRELGATATIDYTKTSFEKVVREAGGADAVLDPMAWLYMARTLESGFVTESGGVLKPGAKYCHILSTDWAPNEQETSVLVVLQGPFEKWRSWFRQRFVDPAAPRLFSTPVQPDADALTKLARLVDDGRIRPVIDRTFDGLTSAVDAVEYLETGRARGKVVIRVSAHERV